jgi:tetratricopeptide (TPR) repeat protein
MQRSASYVVAALVASLLAASATFSILQEKLSLLERGQELLNRRFEQLSVQLRLAEALRSSPPSLPPAARPAPRPQSTAAAAAASRGRSPSARPLEPPPVSEEPAISLSGFEESTQQGAGPEVDALRPIAPDPASPDSGSPAAASPAPAYSAIASVPASSAAPLAAAPVRPAPEADLTVQRELASGLQCYTQARYREGAARFAAVLALQPENTQARRYYATCLYRANPGDSLRYAEVERHLRLVLLEQPQDVEALEVSGRLRAERECWSDALGFFQRALELRPEDPEFARMAGLCALYGGDAGQAEAYFLKACSLDGGQAEHWHLLALAREQAGRLEEAAAGYLRCLELEPARLQARLRMGLVLLKLGRNPEARDQLQEHVRSRPGVPGLTALGDCLLALGEVGQAEGRWQQALGMMAPVGEQEKHAAAELFLRLCRAAWQRRDAGQCLALAEQGLLCEPLAPLRAFQGMGLLSASQPAKGRALLQAVMEEYPGTEAAAMAAEALGRELP